MKVEDFFDEVYYGHLSDIDIYNTVEKLTDGYDDTKLNLLCRDFDFYFFVKINEFHGSFSDEEIEKKIHEIGKLGKDLPLLRDRSHHRYTSVSSYFDPKKKIKINDDSTEEQKRWRDEFLKELADRPPSIDIIKLLDPHGIEFFSLHRLKSLLVDLKRKHTDAVYKFDDAEPQVNNIQPIHWLKGEESLRKFLDNIKSTGLIENRETDDIIQEHFRQSDKKPQPIKWSKSNRLINYLFWQLREAGLIDKERKYKIITEHFLNRHGKPLKRDSLKNDIDEIKYNSPKGSKVIDNIIESLQNKPLQ